MSNLNQSDKAYKKDNDNDNNNNPLMELKSKISPDPCAICWEENPNIATLCCASPVHFHCLVKWTKKNPTCMICRSSLSPFSPHDKKNKEINSDSDDDEEESTRSIIIQNLSGPFLHPGSHRMFFRRNVSSSEEEEEDNASEEDTRSFTSLFSNARILSRNIDSNSDSSTSDSLPELLERNASDSDEESFLDGIDSSILVAFRSAQLDESAKSDDDHSENSSLDNSIPSLTTRNIHDDDTSSSSQVLAHDPFNEESDHDINSYTSGFGSC